MATKNLNLMDDEELELIGEALSSPIRRKILALVTNKSYSILELARELNVALSTMSFHIKMLKNAGLVKTMSSPDKRGNEKNVSQDCYDLYIKFSKVADTNNNLYTVELPIGSYTNFEISAPCCICDGHKIVDDFDITGAFYSPERLNAQLISFYKGFLEYKISTHPILDKEIESITFSLEICSECPNYNNHWKSDITFWINGIELCTYRSPGDYGDRRGILNPNWWPEKMTQYGMLKKIRIDKDGTWLDEILVSNIKIDNINLSNSEFISLKLGVKESSKYVGGINLFGKNFGDHNQDIIIQIAFKNK